MPDKPKVKELGAMLAILEKELQELTNLLKSPGQSPPPTPEAQKILPREASGRYRGELSLQENGAAGLSLSDDEAKARAWLGVDQSREAFLELKDHRGESSSRLMVGPPSSGAEEEKAAAPPTDLHPDAPQPSELLSASPQPTITAAEGGTPGGEPLASTPRATPSQEQQPGSDADRNVLNRLEKWERQHRRQNFVWIIILIILGVVLAAQAFLLMRLHPLRPSKINVGDKIDLPGPTGEKGAARVREQQPQGVSPSGSEAGTGASPAVRQAEPAAQARNAEAEVVFVGAKNSNKYHYPTCKWARKIGRSNLITFKSVAEAQAHHYIPCPGCKPPPLSQ